MKTLFGEKILNLFLNIRKFCIFLEQKELGIFSTGERGDLQVALYNMAKYFFDHFLKGTGWRVQVPSRRVPNYS